MKLPETKNKWYDKKKIITVMFLSVSLSFTVFFFSPTDIFLGNQKEFYIGANHIFISLLLLAICGSFVLTLIGILALKHKTVYNVVTSLLFGLLLAFYVQMLFFNGRMTVMRTVDLSYDSINFFNMFNFIIMYLIFMAPLILTVLREKYNGNNALMNFAKGKVILYLSAFIFAMQFFGSIGMLVSNGIYAPDNSSIYCFDLEPIFSLSKEENITIFLVDTLDGKWMDDTLERYPEINEKLEGFTYYQNNVSRYSSTFPSVPCMLSNKEYDHKNENKYDYLNEVWQDENLFTIISKNNYKVNILADNTTTFNSFFQLSDYNNVVQAEKSDYYVNYFGKYGVIDTMVNLSLAKLLPYLFKNIFIFNIYDTPSENFLIFNDDLSNYSAAMVSMITDIKLDKYINEYGMNTDSKQKNFSFIHMNGVHSPYTEISSLDPSFNENTETADIISTTRGCFEILFKYFDIMKDLGVYDSSTIIIIADHGDPLNCTTSALLIKQQNAEHDPLKFDSESELSNNNFFASVLEYAGIDHSEYGYSYNDIIEGGYHQDRYLSYSYANNIRDKLYKISGDARDESNWEEISPE